MTALTTIGCHNVTALHALFLDFHVKHRWVVVFAERLVRVVLPGLVVVLEEDERDFLEGDGLSVFAVTLDVGFGKTFHAHHFEHHGQVKGDVEELVFQLDADDRGGVEPKVLDFYLFHLVGIWGQKCEKKLNFEEFARKLLLFGTKFLILYKFLKDNTMRKTLIIIAMALLAMPTFAQTIETVDVTKASNGKFTTKAHDFTIEGQVVNGKKEGTWIEYFNSNTYLPKKIVNYVNGKKNGVFVEIDKTGSITKKAEYKDDVLEGQASEWYRGGRLSKLNTYKNGKLNGKQILCYEKGGNLEVSEYKDGQRDGLTTWFYEDGQKKMTIVYKEGEFNGKQESFYPDGQLKSEATYKNGVLQGKKKTYAEKAQPKTDNGKKK